MTTLKKHSAKDYEGKDELFIMQEAKNYNRYLTQCILSSIKKGSVLDFGAGIGLFADLIKPHCDQLSCLEIDPTQVEILSKNGHQVVTNLDDISDNTFDVIYSLNVLEHIKNDLDTLAKLHKKLKPDGLLYLYLPARQELYSSFDKKVGHYRRYHKKDLIDKVKTSGFSIDTCVYKDTLGYIVALIFKFVSTSDTISVSSIRIYDKVIFPISKVFDKIFRGKIPGKNIEIICRK